MKHFLKYNPFYLFLNQSNLWKQVNLDIYLKKNFLESILKSEKVSKYLISTQELLAILFSNIFNYKYLQIEI